MPRLRSKQPLYVYMNDILVGMLTPCHLFSR